jgi:hypothetical protein
MTPIAHRPDHDLSDHLRSVAALARGFVSPALGELAERAGIWHDLGKYRPGFQAYVREDVGADTVGVRARCAHRRRRARQRLPGARGHVGDDHSRKRCEPGSAIKHLRKWRRAPLTGSARIENRPVVNGGLPFSIWTLASVAGVAFNLKPDQRSARGDGFGRRE